MLLLNGTLLAAQSLPLPNRGFTFGDGFFETLIVENGRLRLAADHWARMEQAAAALYLELPDALDSAEKLEKQLARLAEVHTLRAARLRLHVWRAGAGLYTPESSAAEWLATAAPYVANDSLIMQADFARQTHSIYSPLSFCKGPQAWIYVRAAHERQQRGLDEIILCDTAGHVAEAGAAAIFWMKDGMLYTPSLESGCVAGVRRAQVLRAARAAGVKCHQGLFKEEVLLAANAVFTANAAAVRLVRHIGWVAFAGALPPFLARVVAQTDEKW
ncbi:aminotransferase class IV [Hymenobacter saemangeumensis]|uniref:branched-chain-amino-acid transaminase n=1 Tax=Hymenobacter saemangeumensis TaxID=1084522 RepID=A0ABP8IG36_9BACT